MELFVKLWKTAPFQICKKFLRKFLDPPPDYHHHKNRIISSLCHDQCSLKISFKPFSDFLSYLANTSEHTNSNRYYGIQTHSRVQCCSGLKSISDFLPHCFTTHLSFFHDLLLSPDPPVENHWFNNHSSRASSVLQENCNNMVIQIVFKLTPRKDPLLFWHLMSQLTRRQTEVLSASVRGTVNTAFHWSQTP